MPHYFFHLFEGNTQNLVRDSQGTSLPDAGEATKEAIGLARDIAQHGFDGSTWQIIVADANAAIVLKLPLSGVRPRKVKPWLDLARRAATYEPNLRPHIFTWLLTVAVFVVTVQAATLNGVSRSTSEVTGSLGAIPKGTSFWRLALLRERESCRTLGNFLVTTQPLSLVVPIR
jgi:uncharacterized protein DUF6894